MTSNKVKAMSVMAMVSVLTDGFVSDVVDKYVDKNTLDKECLNCGELHNHNNSFCSGPCCKEWRANQKK